MRSMYQKRANPPLLSTRKVVPSFLLQHFFFSARRLDNDVLCWDALVHLVFGSRVDWTCCSAQRLSSKQNVAKQSVSLPLHQLGASCRATHRHETCGYT